MSKHFIITSFHVIREPKPEMAEAPELLPDDGDVLPSAPLTMPAPNYALRLVCILGIIAGLTFLVITLNTP